MAKSKLYKGWEGRIDFWDHSEGKGCYGLVEASVWGKVMNLDKDCVDLATAQFPHKEDNTIFSIARKLIISTKRLK